MKESKTVGLIRLSLIVLFTLIGFTFLSCTEEPCEDCYTFTYSDGSEEWMCVEYECGTEYYYY
jgi:hypothetical protein